MKSPVDAVKHGSGNSRLPSTSGDGHVSHAFDGVEAALEKQISRCTPVADAIHAEQVIGGMNIDSSPSVCGQ